jgi:hypothetical protein
MLANNEVVMKEMERRASAVRTTASEAPDT